MSLSFSEGRGFLQDCEDDGETHAGILFTIISYEILIAPSMVY